MSSRKLAFISYRRDDTSQIAQPLYLQLKEAFGIGQLFMDVHSIRSGEPWPERLRQKLQEVTVLLALIGPRWLFAADQDGRRRIDDPADWVRNEILEALQRAITVIPIVIDDANIPRAEALPTELERLAFIEPTRLRLAPREWSEGVAAICNTLEQTHGLVRERALAQPVPDPVKARTPVLTPDELAVALEALPGWDAWTDSLLFEYPKIRHELRRTLTFENFPEAIAFMNALGPVFERAKHHPRWENAWNVVRIRLTTWDVQNQITHYDVEMAHTIDAAYREFNVERGR